MIIRRGIGAGVFEPAGERSRTGCAGSLKNVGSVRAWVALSGLLILWLDSGEAFSADTVALRSHSGQFLVRGLRMTATPAAPAPDSPVTYVRLDPALLAVSCERIKAALLDELAMKDHWRGSISIFLHPVEKDHEPIVVTSSHYTDGWNYRLEIPDQVNEERLVKSIVEVLLMEMANRNARSRPADLPLWLTEGFSAHLRATALPSFTLEPETRVSRKQRGLDPLNRARERLRTHVPMTLNELSWPSEEQLSEEQLGTYQSCAQLFVGELLRLSEGRACWREMLAHLAENLNWQTAFLSAFRPYFQRLIDVDKWWSLHVVHLTGQGLSSVWIEKESSKQLDDILITPVQVRLSSAELPLTTQAKLQSILAEWDFQRQRPVMLQKLNQLAALRLRTSQDLSGLVEEYRQTIHTYLQKRSKAASARKAKISPAEKLIVNDAIRRLDHLDQLRETSRQQTRIPNAQLTTSH